ncbi:MAG: hypothetical protein E6I39_13875, partial [Chloroflexi bacterium]
MKLSERFDRRYQQTPLAVPVPPGAQPPSAPAAPLPAPAATTAQVIPIPSAERAPTQPPEQSTKLTPALAGAKNEIHAQLLAHHTAQIDLNNRPGIRRLLQQLTEEHFRAKPGLGVTTADKERLVETLFDEVVGLGPLETLLRDPDITEVMVNRPEQIFVERRGRIELTSLAFEDED